MASALFQINGYQVPPTPIQYTSRSNPCRRSSSTVKITNLMSAQSQPSYWATLNVDIEAYLKKAIPVREPLTVFEPMHHLVFHAPPCSAPALCIAACEAIGGSREQAMAAAAAVRLMHAAKWTHDDVISTHVANSGAFKSNIKLMTGDGILPFGFELLARSEYPDEDITGRVLRVLTEIAHAAGSEGMVKGQYEKVLYNYNQIDSVESGLMERAWDKTEGELHACAGACGAILGGGNEEVIEKLRKFCRYVGIIQGMVNWGEKGREERTRRLALNELRDMNEAKIEELAKLVELDSYNV